MLYMTTSARRSGIYRSLYHKSLSSMLNGGQMPHVELLTYKYPKKISCSCVNTMDVSLLTILRRATQEARYSLVISTNVKILASPFSPMSCKSKIPTLCSYRKCMFFECYCTKGNSYCVFSMLFVIQLA